MKKLTNTEFIKRANSVHGNYDYSKVVYTNSNTKVEIICPIHGSFFQLPNAHIISKQGCPKCGVLKRVKKSTDDSIKFIKKANSVHGNYDYSKVDYINSRKKVEIICPVHGSFFQQPQNHINLKQGCPKCSGNIRLTTEEFIERANSVHGQYDYSKVDYVNGTTKVEIICSTHGSFWQSPAVHTTKKAGCPKCKESRGEQQIREFLEENNINYQQEYRTDCYNKVQLPFDFYLRDYNTIIEFDGIQHFKPIKFFGGDETFSKQQINDQIKNDYCLNNNIKLIRIRYDEINNISNILKEYKGIYNGRYKVKNSDYASDSSTHLCKNEFFN